MQKMLSVPKFQDNFFINLKDKKNIKNILKKNRFIIRFFCILPQAQIG